MSKTSADHLRYDVLIGSEGFAGSAVTRELADAGRKVHVIEKRMHIAGNAHCSFEALVGER